MRILFKFGLIIVGAATIVVMMRMLFPLPSLDGRQDSTALSPSADTTLGAAILPAMVANEGASGVLPLLDGRDAFAARALLARAAEESIDAQYYIWHHDTTGLMLLDELRDAAERGVRIRLLVDDDGSSGLDAELAALNALETMEVRLFNPFTLRSLKKLSYMFDFPRLNRRMHNKTFTVDGVATILGGRNVGDDYFAYGTGLHFFDLDALVVGQAAVDVAADFDRYWESGSSYPADRILPPAPDGLELLREAASAAASSEPAQAYIDAIESSSFVRQLSSGSAPLEWVPVTVVSDDPAKGQGKATEEDLLVGRLWELLAAPEAQVDVVSAYYIPGEEGMAVFSELAGRGVTVRVLTNSAEATDVVLVHSAYAKYRPALLAAGVQLLELRADHGGVGQRQRRLFKPSAASLHAKTFAIDRERVFIGSLNLDPRSIWINTEMGTIIESPRMAGALADLLDTDARLAAYTLRLAPDGNIEWVRENANGANEILEVEPGTTTLGRWFLWAASFLPIEWML